MAAGLLEVDGSIDIAQFWPVGSSDADTSQMRVDVAGEVFRFRPNDDAPFQVTHALDNARVKGSATYDAIRNGKITVRLQGMDAPELHYRPTAAKKKAVGTSSSVSSSPRPRRSPSPGSFKGLVLARSSARSGLPWTLPTRSSTRTVAW